MNASLLITLQNYGLSEKEARIYLTVLELWTSITSTIARRAELHRATTYTLLVDLKRDWFVNETTKNGIKYYSVISPDTLLKQAEQKYENFKEKVPELLAMAEKFWNKPKVQFYDGEKWLKFLFKEIILSGENMPSGEPFLTFVWTNKIDPNFLKWLNNEWSPWRLKFKRKSKAIAAKSTSKYADFNIKKHDSIVIDDPIFDFANEIVMYGNTKVAILMYQTNELCGLSIDNLTLHNGLKSMFNLIRNLYKKNNPDKKKIKK
jgi:predicted transcriptional regulator